MLAKALGPQVHQLISGLDAVDADLAFLQQLLHEQEPQRDLVCARTVGVVSRDVQHRRVIDVQRHILVQHFLIIFHLCAVVLVLIAEDYPKMAGGNSLRYFLPGDRIIMNRRKPMLSGEGCRLSICACLSTGRGPDK